MQDENALFFKDTLVGFFDIVGYGSLIESHENDFTDSKKMSRRNNDFLKKPEMPFWMPDGNLWYAEKSDLEAAIVRSQRTTDDIQRRMGVGYHHLEDALNGKRLDKFAASHVEWEIFADSEIKT